MSHHFPLISYPVVPGTPSLQTVTDTISYCGPFEYRNGALSRVNFPGGFIKDDSVYHCIHDHQGNVRQVINAATGEVAQEYMYLTKPFVMSDYYYRNKE